MGSGIKMQFQNDVAFQIKTIQIQKFDFEQIDRLVPKKQIAVQLGVGSIAEKKDKNTYIIQTDIDISFLQTEKKVFYIKFSIIAIIAVEPNFDEKFLNDMVAIMYSYLRPLAAQMTVMAKLPPLDLPPLNFDNFEVKVKSKQQKA